MYYSVVGRLNPTKPFLQAAFYFAMFKKRGRGQKRFAKSNVMNENSFRGFFSSVGNLSSFTALSGEKESESSRFLFPKLMEC